MKHPHYFEPVWNMLEGKPFWFCPKCGESKPVRRKEIPEWCFKAKLRVIWLLGSDEANNR